MIDRIQNKTSRLLTTTWRDFIPRTYKYLGGEQLLQCPPVAREPQRESFSV
jgi:hypothetical protein